MGAKAARKMLMKLTPGGVAGHEIKGLFIIENLRFVPLMNVSDAQCGSL